MTIYSNFLYEIVSTLDRSHLSKKDWANPTPCSSAVPKQIRKPVHLSIYKTTCINLFHSQHKYSVHTTIPLSNWLNIMKQHEISVIQLIVFFFSLSERCYCISFPRVHLSYQQGYVHCWCIKNRHAWLRLFEI